MTFSETETVNILEEDFMEVESVNNEIIIRPGKMIRPDQEYFYTFSNNEVSQLTFKTFAGGAQ